MAFLGQCQPTSFVRSSISESYFLHRAGYDMEDAMILNKSAVDRGLAHGTLFKTEGLDLREDKGKTMVGTLLYTVQLVHV